MLLAIRDQVKGWLAVVIFALLIIPFAFWGVNYYFDQSGGVAALEVNGEEISLADYRRAYQGLREQWQALSGRPVPEEAEPLLKEQTLENLVQTELFRQTGRQLGLRVSDQEVWDAIQQLPSMNDENGFSPELFSLAAGQVGLTPEGFKEQLRQDLASQQLQEALLGTDFVTEAEVSAFARLQNQKRDFSYAILSADELKESHEPTEEEIEARYQDTDDRYMEPEKVRIAYLVLSLAKIAEEVYLEAGEAEDWFNDNKRDYEVEETRKVRQLIVKTPEDASEETLSLRQAKAQALFERVKAGQSFEEVVVTDLADASVEFSEFGFLTRGALEPEVEEVVFAMAAGEIAEPVRSKEGFHIMAVDEIRDGTTVSFSELRAEVEKDLRQDKARQQLYELTDRLATLTYENPDTLEVASEDLELTIQRSDFISREEPGVGIVAAPRVVLAAFSDEVLLQGNNSDVIELDDDRYIALRTLEHIEAQKKPLEQVRDQIVTRLKFEAARDETRERGELIQEKLQEGRSQGELAAEFDLDWKDATDVARDNESINRAVLRAAFKAGRPAAGQPRFNGASLGTGDYALVIVRSVAESGEDAMGQDERDQLRLQLQEVSALSVWEGFTKSLQADAAVEIYEETL